MLRKRSRATTKQALMADYSSIPSPTETNRKPTSSIFLSPRLFAGFASKGSSTSPDTESVLSPTSILDTKLFSALRNPFWSDSPKSEAKTHFDKLDSRGVGLGIVDELITDELSDPKLSKSQSRMVLFGSQLKIQIPPLPLPSSVLSPADSSPGSPGDFGIKTRSTSQKSPFGSANSGLGNPNSPRVFAGCLSASEMELSEDYTCVITHGPNPKTTHIFDNCIVESCCGVVGMSSRRKEYGFHGNRSMSYPSESFLSFCYSCKKNLGHGKDIYMYRGEKAFCSSECRHKEMMLEEGTGMEKMEPESSDDDDDIFVAFP
ncbi:hypothetical protein C3L33_14980, partial [Rhododendron williamsianum]